MKAGNNIGFIPFYGSFIIPGTVFVGAIAGGIYTYTTLIFVFLVIPLCDLLDKPNGVLNQEDLKEVNLKFTFRVIPVFYSLLQTAFLLFLIWKISVDYNNLSFEFIGLILSMGVVTGSAGIAVAHELIHKSTVYERSLGKLLLLQANYLHYFLEHTGGHHVNVATPIDPSSARLGESFYRFFPRTLIGSLKSAVHIEKNRLEKKFEVSFFSLKNRIIQYLSLQMLLLIIIGLIFGWAPLFFFLFQSIIAFTILEIINYVEHYGLSRKLLSNGKYERVTAAHSWESNGRFSNYIFFKFQRHADHHLHPNRSYHLLQSCDESPKLPTGYVGMAMLALLPPLWRRIMDPLIEK